jgi:hypothetical protein
MKQELPRQCSSNKDSSCKIPDREEGTTVADENTHTRRGTLCRKRSGRWRRGGGRRSKFGGRLVEPLDPNQLGLKNGDRECRLVDVEEGSECPRLGSNLQTANKSGSATAARRGQELVARKDEYRQISSNTNAFRA